MLGDFGAELRRGSAFHLLVSVTRRDIASTDLVNLLSTLDELESRHSSDTVSLSKLLDLVDIHFLSSAPVGTGWTYDEFDMSELYVSS